jgi:hypothetical protein
MGEKPRFANHNLGWISVGKEIEEIDVLQKRIIKNGKIS